MVDRIYIRKGQKGFNSVAFRILKGSPVPFGRFWAKLDEVNQGLAAKVAPKAPLVKHTTDEISDQPMSEGSRSFHP